MNSKFLTFFDGTVLINGVNHQFGERTMGYKRHYAARTAGVHIARLIHIPYTTDISVNSRCKIGDNDYIIENVQIVRDSYPPCTVLSLSEYGVR